MKVKFLTLACGPEGNFNIGAVADLPEDKAQALVDGGYAEAVIAPTPKVNPVEAVETAAAPVAEVEKAVAPPAKKAKK